MDLHRIRLLKITATPLSDVRNKLYITGKSLDTGEIALYQHETDARYIEWVTEPMQMYMLVDAVIPNIALYEGREIPMYRCVDIVQGNVPRPADSYAEVHDFQDWLMFRTD